MFSRSIRGGFNCPGGVLASVTPRTLQEWGILDGGGT